MKKKNYYLVEKLNCLSLRKKLVILQLVCVLLPLLITDSFIINILVKAEEHTAAQDMEKIADAVKYDLTEACESASVLVEKIYTNPDIKVFLETSFESPLDYYNRYLEITSASAFLGQMNSVQYCVALYATTPGLISGGCFQALEKAEGTNWYEEFIRQDKDVMLFVDYAASGWESRRTLSVIRKMDYYNKNNSKNILKLDFDYSNLLRSIVNARYSSTVYVCNGDRILFSNDGRGGVNTPFELITEEMIANAGVHKTIGVYDNTWDIYVMPVKNSVKDAIYNNRYTLLILLLVNLFLPIGLMNLINWSFTERLTELDKAIASVKRDELYELPEISGNDEISMLMKSYNDMAGRVNSLIQNEYKSRIKRQESDIARQKAELLALHSQINPHFLFNALESIRMHSVLKNEMETAGMVEKLALMQRQYVEWGNDSVPIHEELRFAGAYLELQKYRFGNRLNYQIEMDAGEDYLIPKLSLVTFVENACVHGMEEAASSCWVFVHVFRIEDSLVVEIEDTSNGINEDERVKLEREMNEVNIEMLQNSKSVGILNAALRLRMMTDNVVHFRVTSEPGSGMMITIELPLRGK